MANFDLYHGSDKIVEKPQFGIGNSRNDYGLGFYCTKNVELAKEWACTEKRDGFANHYKLYMKGLSVLKLNSRGYNILNWLAILLENRTFDITGAVTIQAKRYILENFLPEYSKYDVIIGYRADDSYFSFSKAFLNNGISLEQLSRAMHLGRLGEQVVIKSKAAFDKLLFKDAEPVKNEIYYPLRSARDREARESFIKMQSSLPVTDAVYVIDILREKWTNDDTRLQHILPG